MPSKIIMDLHKLSSSSYFSEEVHHAHTERQMGFWKQDNAANHYGGKLVAASPLEEFLSGESQNMRSVQHSEPYLIRDPILDIASEKHAVGAEGSPARSLDFLKQVNRDPQGSSNAHVQTASYTSQGSKINTTGAHYENDLFSSSLSEIFSRKLRLLSNNHIYGHSVDTVSPQYVEEEPFESLEEIEAQTIGNLLPDDDDLLFGLNDGVDYVIQPRKRDEVEDLDLFSSVGGMDLEDDGSSAGHTSSDYSGGISKGQPGGYNGSITGEHPYGEHPSRTLFVRNINSNVEDSELQALFERHGDIQTLYTACKHRGFVMISYFDIRAACNAMRELQNKSLRRRKLDIHFSIPKDNPSEKDINHGTLSVHNLDSSVSNDELRQMFGVYGEIKEIRESSNKSHHKIVEFYDVRAAQAALRALDKINIAGKTIKVELSQLGCARSVTQLELEHDDILQLSGTPSNTTRLSGSMTNGNNMGVHSARASISPFLENSFYHSVSSSVPNSLLSLGRIESIGVQSGFPEMGHSQGQMKFEYQGMPGLHPHSLPECHDSFPCNSSGSIAANNSPISAGRFENIQLHGLSSNRTSVEVNEGNGRSSLPGHQYAWNHLHRPRHPGMIWPKTPSFVNGFCAPHPTQWLHRLPRAPAHMLNPISPISNHHVGSAPAINPSLWDRQHAFAGESPEASAFHVGSLGSLRMSNNSLQPMEFFQHNIFHHGGGNCMDPSVPPKNIGLHSHSQRCQFPGRGQMIPGMNSFDPPNERARGRKTESLSSQADNKKQFELDIDRILRGEDNRTTLMIKNIPNKYTSKMLLAAIDERHKGTYDFIYLPIDFKNKCNVGYAFINMIDPGSIVPFYQAFNGKKWEKFNSEKVASLAYARIQGKAALIAHFQNSSLMNEDKRCRPILFHTDGPNAGDQVPFPMGVNIRPRPGKTRTSANEDQESPRSLRNGEGFSGSDSSSVSAKDSD